jgi:hypothetical protein
MQPETHVIGVTFSPDPADRWGRDANGMGIRRASGFAFVVTRDAIDSQVDVFDKVQSYSQAGICFESTDWIPLKIVEEFNKFEGN